MRMLTCSGRQDRSLPLALSARQVLDSLTPALKVVWTTTSIGAASILQLIDSKAMRIA